MVPMTTSISKKGREQAHFPHYPLFRTLNTTRHVDIYGLKEHSYMLNRDWTSSVFPHLLYTRHLWDTLLSSLAGDDV